jgi:hypothetical protein
VADASLAAGDNLTLQHRIEGQNLQQLSKGTSNAKSVTLSFWVKSNKTGTYIAELRDQDNSRVYGQQYTISASNTWEKKTLTYSGDTTGSLDNDNLDSLRVLFFLLAGTDFTSGTLSNAWATSTNANRAVGQVNLADTVGNDWYITGVQLEVGEATPFEHRSYGDELARCQRYYGKYYLHKGNEYMTHGGNISLSSNFSFPTTMRATPTSTHVQNINASNCNSSNITFVDFDGASYQVNMHVTSGTVSRRDIYAFDAEL